jgi:hypothetical protein
MSSARHIMSPREPKQRRAVTSNPELRGSMPRATPAGFVPITDVAVALGMSVAALQRTVDATGRVRAVVARDGQVLVHRDEALALRGGVQ